MLEKGCTSLFFVAWIGIWTVVTIGADVGWAYGVWRQASSESFSTAEGTVLESKVVRTRSDDSYNYTPTIRYEYEVLGEKYESDCIRFGTLSHTQATAKAWVKQHPKGKKLKVFYDPNDPADCLLSTGIEGGDLFMIMFLTPFNLIMIGSLWFAAHSVGLIKGEDPRTIQVRQLVEDDFQSRVREAVTIYHDSPLVTAGVILGITSFISVFIVGFGISSNPSMSTMFTVFAINLALAFLPFLADWKRKKQHLNELIVDPQQQLIITPCKLHESAVYSETIPFDAIQRITTDDQDLDADSGADSSEDDALEVLDNQQNIEGDHFAPYIHWRDSKGESRVTQIGNPTNIDRAQAIVDWLEGHVLKQ